MKNNEFLLALKDSEWKKVFIIPRGTILPKGRHGLYHKIMASAATVPDRFGCYAWGNHSEIYYCGSFSQDYTRKEFRTNLHGRIHNYLQNHRQKPNGRKNTNLVVFENINNSLLASDVILFHLVFKSVQVGAEEVDFNTFSNDSYLVRAIEQLLISSYRKQNQCSWNRI